MKQGVCPVVAFVATSSRVVGYGLRERSRVGHTSRLPRDALQNPGMTCDQPRGDAGHARTTSLPPPVTTITRFITRSIRS